MLNSTRNLKVQQACPKPQWEQRASRKKAHNPPPKSTRNMKVQQACPKPQWEQRASRKKAHNPPPIPVSIVIPSGVRTKAHLDLRA
ncbi:uncharacterized protein [Procambarus clarkii]|uniref:uncharacterized protein isoform X3 n=1 Tax=Procambarus clarkii TaxID=6728 RepID=UPI0037449FD7